MSASLLGRASRIIQGTLDADVQVLSGGTVTVFGIILSNTEATNVEITFSDNDDNELFSLSVPAEDTEVFDVPFLADNGIKADALSANQKVTFFTSQAGA